MYIIDDELYHFGILGQKWGIRRYQNRDGSLTEAGKVRYKGFAGKVRYVQDVTKNKKRLKKMAEGRKRAAEIAKQTAENKKKWSKNAYDLEKHMDEYTPVEYAKAKADLLERESLRKIQLEEVKRGKEYFDTAANIVLKGIEIYSKGSSALNMNEQLRKSKAEANEKESTSKLTIAKNKQEMDGLKKKKGLFGNNETTDDGKSKTEGNGTENKTANDGKPKTENKDSSGSDSAGSESKTSSDSSSNKPNFYSQLKDKATSAAKSALEKADNAANSSAKGSFNDFARTQAQAQNAALNSSKESLSSSAKTAAYAANFAGVTAENYAKTAVSKVSDAAKWYGSTAKDVASTAGSTIKNAANAAATKISSSDFSNAAAAATNYFRDHSSTRTTYKVNTAEMEKNTNASLDYIEEWTKKTLGN